MHKKLIQNVKLPRSVYIVMSATIIANAISTYMILTYLL